MDRLTGTEVFSIPDPQFVWNGWDMDLAAELFPVWQARGLLAGCFIDAEDLVNAVDALLRSGPSLSTPSITIAPRPPTTQKETP